MRVRRSRGTGTPASETSTPCQFTGMRRLPEASSAILIAVAAAVQGGSARKQSAWKSFGRGSAVKCEKTSFGTVVPHAPSSSASASTQASVPLKPAHAVVASPHGRGSPTAVTAIAAGPESVSPSAAGANSVSVSGNAKTRRRSPRSRFVTVASALAGTAWHVVSVGLQELVSTGPQSVLKTTRRAVPPPGGLNAIVTTWSLPFGRNPADAVSHGRSRSSTDSPGAANGRLAAPSAEP